MTALSELSDWSLEDLRIAATMLHEDLVKAAPLSPDAFHKKQDQLVDATKQKLAGYAAQVASGKLSPAKLRSQMTTTLRTATAAAYQNGASSANGRVALDDGDHAAIAKRFGKQLDWLDGFVDDVKGDDDKAGSETYLSNRAGMYADSLTSAFWAGQMSQHPDDAKVYYDAEDDDSTCEECEAAEKASPYKPSEAPIPGEVCAGMGRCRCTLRVEGGVAKGIADEIRDAHGRWVGGGADEVTHAWEKKELTKPFTAEKGIVVDRGGNVVKEATGFDPNSDKVEAGAAADHGVDLSTGLRDESGFSLTHRHPENTSDLYSTGLSNADMRISAMKGHRSVRAVTSKTTAELKNVDGSNLNYRKVDDWLGEAHSAYRNVDEKPKGQRARFKLEDDIRANTAADYGLSYTRTGEPAPEELASS